MKEEMIQDSKIVEQIVDDMDLFDDDLMSMVFDRNIPATELLLKIILKQGDITVISVVSQRGFQNPIVGGRDIRLDILAKDITILKFRRSRKGRMCAAPDLTAV